MKSLICSDIHDRVKNLESALELAVTSNCDSVICCGDLCSPFIIDVFHEYFKKPVHIIFGNNDGDQFNILNKTNLYNSERDGNNMISCHGQFLIKSDKDKLQGIPSDVTLSAYHYPQPAMNAYLSNKFKYVFYGHTHAASLESDNGNYLINPGSLMGYIPGKNRQFVKPTCVILDWLSSQADLIEL